MANFTTLAQYKILKNINSTNKDAEINMLIPFATEYIKRYLKRTIIDFYGSPTKTEYFDSNLDTVYLKEFPIVGSPNVAFSQDGGVTYTVIVENTDYFINAETGYLFTGTTGTGFKTATNPHNSLRVIYNGGESTTPDEIELACILLVAYWLEEQYVDNKVVNTNVISTFPPEKLPHHIRSILEANRELL